MISKRDLDVVVAGEIERYAGDMTERTAEIIIDRNRAGRRDRTWSSEWSAAMSGGGLARYEAEVRRQCAEMLGIDEPADARVSRAASVLGRRGGSVASEAQRSAARENGKRGGRPKRER